MGLGINITFTPDRAEQINGRLLALQVEIGGCVLYVADNEIRWEPDDLWAHCFDTLCQALDKMVEFEVFDPAVDEFKMDEPSDGDQRAGATWSNGFQAGFKNGLAFRNNSIPALQASLSEAEAKIAALNMGAASDRDDILRLQNEARDLLAVRDKVDTLLQQTGDGIAKVFDQLTKGNWVDDHGHPVANNAHMLAMQNVLLAIMHFRADHLDYEKVSVPPTPCTEPGCVDTWEGSDAFPTNG